jgi:hypothetical protein
MDQQTVTLVQQRYRERGCNEIVTLITVLKEYEAHQTIEGVACTPEQIARYEALKARAVAMMGSDYQGELSVTLAHVVWNAKAALRTGGIERLDGLCHRTLADLSLTIVH